MINYIIKVVLFQALFLLIYDLFLSKETFFNKNRIYLLGTLLFSFLIPLIKIPVFQQVIEHENVIQLPEIILNPQQSIQSVINPIQYETTIDWVMLLFTIGIFVFSLLFLFRWVKLYRLIRSNQYIKRKNYRLIVLSDTDTAFSFLDFVFLGSKINSKQKESILKHELVHVKQKHSYDLIFIELLKIFMWFNPVIYLFQKRIALVHEYIADSIVTKKYQKERYLDTLLSSYFSVNHISFINQFYKGSIIKKRILMITKNESKSIHQFKYILILPVLICMLLYTSCSEDSFERNLISYKTPKKEYQKRYLEIDNEVVVGTSVNKTYLDFYTGYSLPAWREISKEQLNDFENDEFCKFIEECQKRSTTFYKLSTNIKLYQKKDNRKVIAVLIKENKNKEVKKEKIKINSDGSVSVLQVNTTPTFPGCEERDVDCFFHKLDQHFQNNFDKAIPNTLGLSSGIKKAFVMFNIDTNGKIADVNVRAPHPKVKTEVERVLYSLPTMGIGKKDGEPVKVRYTLPFKFVVN